MTEEISSHQVLFPHKLNAAFQELRLTATHPHVARAIIQWWEPDYTELFELKPNGSGKQIVFKYNSVVFLEIIKFAISAVQQRAELSKEQKEAYTHVLVATGLFSSENIGQLLNVSRTTAAAWNTRRSENFPMKRLGGSVSMDTLVSLAQWWEARIRDPDSSSADWLLLVANKNDASWAILARLTGLTMYEIKRNCKRLIDTRTETLNVTINTGNYPVLPAEPEPNRSRHSEISFDSGPEGEDQVEFETDSLIKPPVLGDGGDAFAPAVYLAPNSETDAGSAGQSDASQDGADKGSEVNRRDGSEVSRRPVHAFFQPEAD